MAGTIAVRRETKSPMERRTPVTPDLVKRGLHAGRLIQAVSAPEQLPVGAVEAGLVGSRAMEAEGRFQEAERLRQLAAGQPAGTTGR